MSGKKPGLAGVSWSTCSTCRIKCHNRNLLQKHSELGCGDVHPFITADGNGVFELSLGDGQQPRLGQDIPARKLDDILFINTAFLTEMGLKTLDWVKLTNAKDEVGSLAPVFMRVWAIENGPPYKAFVHQKAVVHHPELSPGKGIINICGILDSIPIATEITFHVHEIPRGLTLKDLQDKLKTWLDGKVAALKTTFRLQLLTHFINVKVTSLSGFDSHVAASDDQPARISKETEIVVTSDSANTQDLIPRIDDVTIDSIGGLTDEIKEVRDTIAYALSKHVRAPRGILLYGEHGTGKTLMMKAICRFFALTPVYFKEHGKKRLHEVFQETIQTGNNSAILIENLDSLSSAKRDGEGTVAFPEELRQEMDSLPNDSGVIVLATAKNLDQVDPILRSAQTFAKEVELPVPSADDRLEILQKLLSPFEHHLSESDIQKLAEDTHGFVGADLEGMRANAFRLAGNDPPSRAHFLNAMKTSRPSAMKSIQLEIPHVRWDDIGGLSDLKFQLKQSVEWPLKHPEAFERLGLTPPKGILMYGPPGCSKTMIAKALATETRLNFISVKGSDLLSKWVGESEKAVQTLFRKARKVAPAILFFDELDALGSSRGGKGSGGGSNVHERVLAQLLVEIDGIEPLNDVTILAATNRPDLIDKALTRPGRLDRIIYVPLPDASTRREILRIKINKMPLAEDVDIDFLVEATEGHSGAEIGGICQEAGLKALEADLTAAVVKKEHFVTALAKSPPRITQSLLAFYESYSKLTQS